MWDCILLILLAVAAARKILNKYHPSNSMSLTLKFIPHFSQHGIYITILKNMALPCNSFERDKFEYIFDKLIWYHAVLNNSLVNGHDKNTTEAQALADMYCSKL